MFITSQTMSQTASKMVVRIASILTLVPSLLAVYWAVRIGIWSIQVGEWKSLAVASLFAAIPALFVWASIQAWRCKREGILSISAVWLLAGISGFIFTFVLFFQEPSPQAIVALMISAGLVLGGLFLERQNPCNDPRCEFCSFIFSRSMQDQA